MTFSGLRRTLMVAALVVSAGTFAAPASADSCWTHNGSMMRLKAEGGKRWFIYEEPRAALRPAGVHAGTLLFSGVKHGNRYDGVARVFSRHCPGSPLEYAVSGPVRGDQLQVTLRGIRPVNEKCQPTGKRTTETLVFTYDHGC